MDLLSAAYGATSDEDADDPSASAPAVAPPPSKRPRWEPRPYVPPPQPMPTSVGTWGFGDRTDAPPLASSASGRYISKRERALLAASLDSSSPLPSPATADFDSTFGSITNSNLRADILHSLRCQSKPGSSKSLPLKLSVSLKDHYKAVNRVDWSLSHVPCLGQLQLQDPCWIWGLQAPDPRISGARYEQLQEFLELELCQTGPYFGLKSHLLASAGMDHTVRVWNVWDKRNTTARVLKYHTAAVKDVRWSLHGPSLLSGGFDCSLQLFDVAEGKVVKVFKEDQAVEVIKFNPSDPNLFLSGGSKGSLKLWDIRSGLVTKEFHRSLGTILDIEFSADGKQFISSTDTTRSNISENTIIIWDVLRQVPLSNQVYTEAFTCPCVRYHPYKASFVAQSNGNYIAIFSARQPFKLNKYMRFEGHGVWGFPIKCNFSLSGRELASGSSDGCIYIYDFKSGRLLRKIEAFKEACTDVAYHPVMPNVIASCSWTGEISVFE
ncbi:hypothetical protein ACP70R_009397 [Stipagrostis hirtigluma subsp. patula]